MVILWGVKDGRVCLLLSYIVPLRCDSGLFCLNFAVGEVSYLLSLSRVGMQIGERGAGDGGEGRGVGVGVGSWEASWMEWTDKQSHGQEQLCRTTIARERTQSVALSSIDDTEWVDVQFHSSRE